jgi:hypothetical protein
LFLVGSLLVLSACVCLLLALSRSRVGWCMLIGSCRLHAMALEVYHFLLNSDDGELQTVIDHAMPFLQYNTHLAIITGAHRTGKTSLLFQYAYNAALAGKQVMPSLQ